MNKITFFIALAVELLAAALTLDVYFGTPKCIISTLILFAACLLIVFGIYSILKRSFRLPQSGKLQFYQNGILKESLIKSRLTAWRTSCLLIFRHITHKFLAIRKYACEISMQSNEKSDCAICTPDLISASLIFTERL